MSSVKGKMIIKRWVKGGARGRRNTNRTGKLLGTSISKNLPITKYLSQKYKSDT
jgi:hypothetical protein